MAKKISDNSDALAQFSASEGIKRNLARDIAEKMHAETNSAPSVRKLFMQTGVVLGTCIDYNIVAKVAGEFRREVENQTASPPPESSAEVIPQNVAKANENLLKVLSVECGRIRLEELHKAELLQQEINNQHVGHINWLQESLDESANHCAILDSNLKAASIKIHKLEELLSKKDKELAAALAKCEMLEKLMAANFMKLGIATVDIAKNGQADRICEPVVDGSNNLTAKSKAASKRPKVTPAKNRRPKKAA